MDEGFGALPQPYAFLVKHTSRRRQVLLYVSIGNLSQFHCQLGQRSQHSAAQRVAVSHGRGGGLILQFDYLSLSLIQPPCRRGSLIVLPIELDQRGSQLFWDSTQDGSTLTQCSHARVQLNHGRCGWRGQVLSLAPH